MINRAYMLILCYHSYLKTEVLQMKNEYIEAITKELERCDDIELLDFIHQLLVKSRK